MISLKEKILGEQEWDEEHRYQIKFNGRYVLNFDVNNKVYDFNLYEGDYYNLMQTVSIFNTFDEHGLHGVVEIVQRSRI